jgi:hypothetical protein
MKILRVIPYLLVIIIILFLIGALFLPSTSHVERLIILNVPSDTFYALVVDYNNYRDWNP